ncbi:uncharacterized protein LOC134828756 [Culicoides brevitarsis]|uniref:uncharacterized protein LOC134828756 n=1 Tax=Culicoides brevitarsis TaxID=469753 RepID=UPI00307CC3CA
MNWGFGVSKKNMPNNLYYVFVAVYLMLVIHEQFNTFGVKCQQTDILFIRHGRSRVRHTTEKDHLRWGLKALDNLTLAYDDMIDIEGNSNETQTDTFNFFDINGTTTGFSLLINNSSSHNNISYNGSAASFQMSQLRERDYFDLQQSIVPMNAFSKNTSSRKNNIGVAETIATKVSKKVVNNNRYIEKKIAKKRIMENIKKDVDKGLEYLKSHRDIIDATVSLIDIKIKRSESILKLKKEEKSQLTSNSKVLVPIGNEVSQTTFANNNAQPISKSDVVLRQIISEQQSIFSKLKPNINNINKISDHEKVTNTINHHNKELYFDSSTSVTSISSKTHVDTKKKEKTFPLITKDIESVSNENSIDEITFIMNDMEDLEGTNSAYQMEEIGLEDLDEVSRENRKNLIKGRDVVTTFLRIVESQHLLGANCTAGTALNLGEGVVDRYAQDRFRVEAEIAVNRANMLTRLFKIAPLAVQESEHLLHTSVLSMVDFDDNIFAAGHCFDLNEHPYYKGLFCPFAYRLPPPDQDTVLVKNLAADYPYLSNTSEWFFNARKNAEKIIDKNQQFTRAIHLYANSTERVGDEILTVKYENGLWSKPYYDCGGGNIWMLTYTVPFFGYENGTYHFKGTAGIDIDLRRVDIDQCPQKLPPPGTTIPLNIFAGTDKCKQRTTECTPVKGLGFRRGSYRCFCKIGFYFPDISTDQKYFNGSTLEEEYEKYMLGEVSTYDDDASYECLPCTEGCDHCIDASPCVAELNWPMRTSILVLACVVIGFLPPATYFTFKYQQVKVVRAASPALLRVIALGAFFIYCTTIVMYPPPSIYTCTIRVWLREIGFSLTYGALMLKTWRISVIFRIRSAKTVIITDASLLKRLALLCCFVGVALLVRTLVAPPIVIVGRTADNLKAFLCKTDFWDHTFTSMEVVFLAWGVRLCIMVRKAPSEFNESRFISMAIYNEFLLTCFLNVSMLFLQSPANPDLLYIIFFCHTQLTVSLLLALIFGSKVYMVLRGGEKAHDEPMVGIKASHTKFIHRSQINKYGNSTTSTAQVGASEKITDQEALEEIKCLQNQLQILLQRTPPNGVAIGTISFLLEVFKQPRSNQLMSTLDIQMNSRKASKESLAHKENKLNVTQMISEKYVVNNETVNSSKINQKSVNDKSEEKEFKKNKILINNVATQTHSNNVDISFDISKSTKSNISFDDLDLKCMCSDEEEEDCHHYIETEYDTVLVNQCSDIYSESKSQNSINENKNTEEDLLNSCENSKTCSPCNCNRVGTLHKKSKKHIYRKQDRKQYECKLDSELIAEKLLKSIKNTDPNAKSNGPPPVPPRKSLNIHPPEYSFVQKPSEGAGEKQNDLSIKNTFERMDNLNQAPVKNKKSPEKRMILDLNDRSKYTEEISV